MLNNKTRPFLLVFPLLAVGIYLSQYAEYAVIAAAVAGVIAVCWFFLEYRGKSGAVGFFWLLMICAGYLLGVTDMGILPDADFQAAVTGEVVSVRRLTYYQRVIVQSPELKAKLAVHLPLDVDLAPGLWLSVCGRVTKPDSARNPGEFDYRIYLRGQGVYAFVEVDEFTVLEKKNRARLFLNSLREYVKNNYRENMRSPQLLTAIVLGDRSELSAQQLAWWEQLGIAHLLSISGMHIGLLAVFIRAVLRPMPGSQTFKTVLFTVLLLVYVLLSGAKPSAWRAWLAAVIAAFGSNRHLDGLHLWSLIGTIMLVISPSYLWQIGFQLSFAASGGIILWNPLIRKLTARITGGWVSRIIKHFVNSIAISLVAQLSIFPLLLYHFSEAALMGPIATYLMLPFVSILLVGGLVLGAFGRLAFLGGFLLDRVTGLTDLLCRLLSNLGCVISVPIKSFSLVWGWFLLFSWMGLRVRKEYIRIGKPTLIKVSSRILTLVMILSMPQPVRIPLEITFLDVGQGDCIFIRTPYKQHILIDGGGDSVYWQLRGRNVGLETVVPYLQYKGVEHIDLVILSHPHEDHLFGLLAVLENFSVGMVLDNGQPHTTATYVKYLELIDSKHIPYRQLRAGDQLLLRGGVRLEIFHPDQLLAGTGSDLNNNSLVINLNYQGRNVLFTGDLDWEGMIDLLQRGNLPQVDLIKVPHHGSKTALLPQFYQTVQPDYAVVTVGKNSFGHPDPDVMEFLADMGIKTARTDQEGAVSFYIWAGMLGRYSKAK